MASTMLTNSKEINSTTKPKSNIDPKFDTTIIKLAINANYGENALNIFSDQNDEELIDFLFNSMYGFYYMNRMLDPRLKCYNCSIDHSEYPNVKTDCYCKDRIPFIDKYQIFSNIQSKNE